MAAFSKQRIDELINIWIRQVTSPSNDAGWEGETMLSRMITYQGDIPPPSGQDQSNAAMIRALRLVRGRHALFQAVNAVVIELLTGDDGKESEKIIALLAKHYYVHTNPITGKPFTDGERCARIGQKYQQYRYNVEKGYQAVGRELARYSRYRAA